jgi:DNA polymerase (family 10)
MLEELRDNVPPGMLQLTRVPGLGPKTAKLLYDRLGVDSVDALRAAIEAERLRDLPGLGAKTEAKLRDALSRMGSKDVERRPMADGIALAEA